MKKKDIHFIDSILQLLDMKIYFIPVNFSDHECLDISCPPEILNFTDKFYKKLDLATFRKEENILHLHSNIGINDLLIPIEDDDCFAVIGPFLNRHISLSELKILLLGNNVQMTVEMGAYYQSLPVLMQDKIASLEELLLIFIDPSRSNSIVRIDQSSIDFNNYVYMTTYSQTDSIENVRSLHELYEKKRIYEDLVYSDVCSGSIEECMAHWEEYNSLGTQMKMTNEDLKALKEQALIENAIYRKGAERSSVPFNMAESTYIYYSNCIGQSQTKEDLKDIRTNIVKSYCRLVKEQSLKKYSILVRKAITYINNNLNSNIPLENIANYCGVTPSYLSTLFRKDVGIHIKNYIAQKRIDQSKVMLRDTAIPISSIAYQVGYEDNNYFSRVFKKYTGITPSDFRESNRKAV